MALQSFISLITPFNKDNEIDFESLDHLIVSHQKTGKKTFLLASEIGEGDFLSSDEKISLFKRVRLLLKESPSIYFKEDSLDLLFQTLLEFKKLGLLSGYIDLTLFRSLEEEEIFNFCFSLSRAHLELIIEPPKQLLTKSFLDQIQALPYLSAPRFTEESKDKQDLFRFDLNSCEAEKESHKKISYLKNFDPFFKLDLQTRKEIIDTKEEEKVLVAKHLLAHKGIVAPFTRIPGALSDAKKSSLVSLVV